MKSVEDILQRNSRVEMDKAWETSATRRVIISLMTYVIALVWLVYVEGDPHPFINALVPSLGFLFSMMSIPFVKNWWIERNTGSFQSDFHEVKKCNMNDSESALGGTERNTGSFQSDFHEVKKRNTNASESASD